MINICNKLIVAFDNNRLQRQTSLSSTEVISFLENLRLQQHIIKSKKLIYKYVYIYICSYIIANFHYASEVKKLVTFSL